MQLRRAWGNAHNLREDILSSLRTPNSVFQAQFLRNQTQKVRARWGGWLLLETNLMTVLIQVECDLDEVHRLLNDGPSRLCNPNRVPPFVPRSFMGKGVIRLFILKYSGDVDGSTTPAWVDQQLEFLNEVKTLTEIPTKKREVVEEDLLETEAKHIPCS